MGIRSAANPVYGPLPKDPDPRFWALNRSLEFDWRLAPYDIDQSQARARADGDRRPQRG